MTLAELFVVLTPLERQFFTLLDAELEKVDTFYKERETEALARVRILKEQLRELKDHRNIFHVGSI